MEFLSDYSKEGESWTSAAGWGISAAGRVSGKLDSMEKIIQSPVFPAILEILKPGLLPWKKKTANDPLPIGP